MLVVESVRDKLQCNQVNCLEPYYIDIAEYIPLCASVAIYSVAENALNIQHC